MHGTEIPTRTKLEKLKKIARNSEWEKVKWKSRMEMKKRNEETETPKQKGEKMDIQTEEERVNQVQIKQEMIEKNAFGILSDDEDEDDDDDQHIKMTYSTSGTSLTTLSRSGGGRGRGQGPGRGFGGEQSEKSPAPARQIRLTEPRLRISNNFNKSSNEWKQVEKRINTIKASNDVKVKQEVLTEVSDYAILCDEEDKKETKKIMDMKTNKMRRNTVRTQVKRC